MNQDQYYSPVTFRLSLYSIRRWKVLEDQTSPPSGQSKGRVGLLQIISLLSVHKISCRLLRLRRLPDPFRSISCRINSHQYGLFYLPSFLCKVHLLCYSSHKNIKFRQYFTVSGSTLGPIVRIGPSSSPDLSF